MVTPSFIVTEAPAAHRPSRCYGELGLLTFTTSKVASMPGQKRSIRQYKNIRSGCHTDASRFVATALWAVLKINATGT